MPSSSLAVGTSGRGDRLVAGLLLLVVGSALVVFGLGWALDYRRLTNSFYQRVLTAWSRLPGGHVYRRVVPLGQFRYGGSLMIVLMGTLLVALGVASLVTSGQ
jgi:hypothetical protein